MNDTSQNKTVKTSAKDPTKGKKRDRSASERSLLKAAEDVFSKHGFKGATTRMVAQKAGVNESLIGRYFDGKMGLLIAIIERHIATDSEYLTKLPYPPQDNLTDELLSFAKFKYERDCKKNFDFFKIVLSQAIVDAKFCKRIREAVPMFYQPQLEERIRALKEKGKIRADADTKHFIKGLDIFMFGNIISQTLLAGASDAESFEFLESFVRRYASLVSVE